MSVLRLPARRCALLATVVGLLATVDGIATGQPQAREAAVKRVPVSVRMTRSADQTNRQLRDAAIEEAKRRALREAFPEEVELSRFVVGIRTAASYVDSFISGLVLNVETGAETGNTQMTEYRLDTVVTVGQPPGERDRGFLVKTVLNHETFRPGDEVVLEVETTRDAALYVFNVTQEGQVLLLLPPDASEPLLVRRGEPFVFPSADDRRKGRRIVAALPASSDVVSEKFWVLAFRQGTAPESWLAGTGVRAAVGGVPLETGTVTDMWKALVRFNRYDWVMEQVGVEIRR